MEKERTQARRGALMLIFVILIVVITVGGIIVIGETPAGTTITHFGNPGAQTPSSSYSMGTSEYVEEEWQAIRSARLQRVSKFIKEGIVQRINESSRQLFVNDAIWFSMSQDRQENVARVVAEYLDVVNENNPGTVAVFSFRSGRLVSEVKEGGVYAVYA